MSIANLYSYLYVKPHRFRASLCCKSLWTVLIVWVLAHSCLSYRLFLFWAAKTINLWGASRVFPSRRHHHGRGLLRGGHKLHGWSMHRIVLMLGQVVHRLMLLVGRLHAWWRHEVLVVGSKLRHHRLLRVGIWAVDLMHRRHHHMLIHTSFFNFVLPIFDALKNRNV